MRLLIVFILICIANLMHAQCDHPDYEGLLKFYADHNGENWIDNTGWSEGVSGVSCDPCNFNGDSWKGVICEDGRVRTLTLWNNGLSGDLKEIEGLDRLYQLRLNGNDLTGSIIDYQNLPNLLTMDLSKNQLDGEIPDFQNLSRMQQFKAADNNLTGPVPDFSNFQSIRILEFSNNKLTGSCPDFSNMSKIRTLRLDNNLLEGVIPEFSNCPELSSIKLSINQFSGPIPTFKNLTGLYYLDLHENKLEGTFPDFENLKPGLVTIDFSKNSLSGNIPSLTGLTTLNNLYLNHNNFQGSLQFLYDLPTLSFFSIEHNSISDTLPSIEHLFSYDEFNVGNNDIYGELRESDIAALTWKTIKIDSNNLSGCIPMWYCDPSVFGEGNPKLPFYGIQNEVCAFDFTYLNTPCDNGEAPEDSDFINENCECISELCFTTHPDLEALLEIYNSTDGDNWKENDGWKAGSLGYSCDPCNWRTGVWYGVQCDTSGRVVCIDMDGFGDCTFTGTSGNNLNGIFPDIKLDKLKTLILDHNKLKGTLPSLENFPSLEKLWFSFNEISGEFPSFNNDSLIEIRCSNNYLEGFLPEFDLLPKLKTFTASNNFFSGCYPTSTCNLELFDFENNLSLPWNGDASILCNGAQQIGALCDDNTGTIQDDCVCGELSSVSKKDRTSLHLYPNPAFEKLLVEFETEVRIEIFDLQGQLMTRFSVKNSEIDITALSDGLYYIKATTASQETFTSRFIKTQY